MSAAKNLILSKSKIMEGLQCEKRLHFSLNQKHLASPVSAGQQRLFDQGSEVGIEAQAYFPGGMLIEAAHTDRELALTQTQDALKKGATTLYEAAFLHEGVFVRVDILHRPEAGLPWELLEVKSSTEVKEEHVTDASIQWWVVRHSGLDVGSVSILHLNNECVYPNLDDLFTRTDITQEVKALEPSTINSIQALLKLNAAPERKIGAHCADPHDCPYKEHCWKAHSIPEVSVFNIPSLPSAKKWEFFDKGLITLEQVRGQKFNELQKRMIETTLSGVPHLDRARIEKEMKKWEYPLYYLDFETIGYAVPRHAGTRPYQQIPFQFSLHVQTRAGGPLEHVCYLHATPDDPRPAVMDALLGAIDSKGSIVAYNKSAEAGVLSHLAEVFPQYAEKVEEMIHRLVDPLPLFRNYSYHPAFKGSFSLKSVAPALVNLSYDKLAVASGEAAQSAFIRLIDESLPEDERNSLYEQMLSYCEQDTLAMVKLVAFLEGLPLTVKGAS